MVVDGRLDLGRWLIRWWHRRLRDLADRSRCGWLHHCLSGVRSPRRLMNPICLGEYLLFLTTVLVTRISTLHCCFLRHCRNLPSTLGLCRRQPTTEDYWLSAPDQGYTRSPTHPQLWIRNSIHFRIPNCSKPAFMAVALAFP